MTDTAAAGGSSGTDTVGEPTSGSSSGTATPVSAPSASAEAAIRRPVDGAAIGGRTNSRSATLSGTAEPGAIVRIYDHGTLVATTTADETGAWSATSTDLTDGVHSYTTTVTDADGNTLLDFAGGIGVLAVGHCPPNVVNAIKDQAEKLIHFCSIVGTYEPYVEVAELMNEVTPGNYPKKTLLMNSGAEAVEAAVHIARSYTGRGAVIVRPTRLPLPNVQTRAFHVVKFSGMVTLTVAVPLVAVTSCGAHRAVSAKLVRTDGSAPGTPAGDPASMSRASSFAAIEAIGALAGRGPAATSAANSARLPPRPPPPPKLIVLEPRIRLDCARPSIAFI